MAEKGVPLLMDAFSRLLHKHTDSELWIIGAGYLRKRLETLCARLGIVDHVKFLGFVEHAKLGRYYDACDVFVLPSAIETQGIVAIEAMRFSRPIIVTDRIVSANELVDDGRNGFIVRPSAEQLAEKLIVLKENQELKASMGLASKLKSESYTTDEIVKTLERMYGRVLMRSLNQVSA